MDKRFIGLLVAVVVALGALFYFSHKSTSGSNGNTTGGSTAAASHHVTGAGKKGVTLIEYGDYQCPACGAFFPVLQQVTQKYGDDITFQFRNFPLDSIHQNARAGARAAEAANLQNKFWEMHDLLYKEQQIWSASTDPYQYFESYAGQLDLNKEQFKTDYQSDKVNSIINADIAEAQKINATATPTFQINGKVIDSETQQTMGTLEGFSKVIDAEIAKVSAGKQGNSAASPAPAESQEPPASPTPAPAPTPQPAANGNQ